jgi:hypothetical protein
MDAMDGMVNHCGRDNRARTFDVFNDDTMVIDGDVGGHRGVSPCGEYTAAAEGDSRPPL